MTNCSLVNNMPGSAGDIGDACLNPGLERFSGGGNGNLLQYSCLDAPLPSPFSVSLSPSPDFCPQFIGCIASLSCLFYVFPPWAVSPTGERSAVCLHCVRSQLSHRRSLNFCQMPEREQGSLQEPEQKIRKGKEAWGQLHSPSGILESLTGWVHQKPSESLGQGMGMVKWLRWAGRAGTTSSSPFHHFFLKHLLSGLPWWSSD